VSVPLLAVQARRGFVAAAQRIEGQRTACRTWQPPSLSRAQIVNATKASAQPCDEDGLTSLSAAGIAGEDRMIAGEDRMPVGCTRHVYQIPVSQLRVERLQELAERDPGDDCGQETSQEESSHEATSHRATRHEATRHEESSHNCGQQTDPPDHCGQDSLVGEGATLSAGLPDRHEDEDSESYHSGSYHSASILCGVTGISVKSTAPQICNHVCKGIACEPEGDVCVTLEADVSLVSLSCSGTSTSLCVSGVWDHVDATSFDAASFDLTEEERRRELLEKELAWAREALLSRKEHLKQSRKEHLKHHRL